MKKSLLSLAILALSASPAYALKLEVNGIKDGQRIPDVNAFCKADGNGKTMNSNNINPQLAWKDIPKSAKSFAVVVVDKDVPSVFDDANKDGKKLPASMPRKDFYHWVLVNIPRDVKLIRQGEDSNGVTEGGKPTGEKRYGLSGKNDFGSFMKGTFGGYDGPCPPWNDERLHNYHFRVYALNTKTLDVPKDFTGAQVIQLIESHSIEMAEVVGTYSTNPAVK